MTKDYSFKESITDSVHDVKSFFVASVARNAGVLTFLASAFILLSAVVFIANAHYVWVPMAVGVIAISSVIFFNGMVILVKVLIAGLLAFLFSSVSYMIGTAINFSDGTATYWFLSYWILATLCLGISYVSVKANSRWGAIVGALCVAFIMSYLVAFTFLSSTVAALSVITSGVLVFFLMYSLTRNAIVDAKKMPQNILTEGVKGKLLEQAEQNEWSIRAIEEKDNKGHFLAWKDKGYILYPIYMEQRFTSVVSRRGRYNGYGYKGTPIGPWLLQKFFSLSPTWKSKGAEMMLVLMDMNNTLPKPNVINVGLPDSHNSVPIGVIPAGSLLGKKGTVIDKLDENFSQFFSRDLKKKQKKALSEIGRTAESAVPQDEI